MRWLLISFALVLHVVLTLRGYPDREHAVQQFVEDLRRPAHFDFCRGWVSLREDSYAMLNWNYPAFLLALLPHRLLTGSPTCEVAMLSARGTLLTALFILPVWWMAGGWLERRWRRVPVLRVSQLHWRVFFRLALIVTAPVALLGSTGIALLPFSPMTGLRMLGAGFWPGLIAIASAQRLGVMPYPAAGSSDATVTPHTSPDSSSSRDSA